MMEVILGAKLVLREKIIEVKAGQTVKHALEKAGIPAETVIPVRDGELITEDEQLQEGETIQLVAVISGGGT